VVRRAVRDLRRKAKQDERESFAQITKESLADMATRILDGPCRSYIKRLKALQRVKSRSLRERMMADFLGKRKPKK